MCKTKDRYRFYLPAYKITAVKKARVLKFLPQYKEQSIENDLSCPLIISH
jgi:hypothetical protein